jgi:hypothetical protein
MKRSSTNEIGNKEKNQKENYDEECEQRLQLL